MTLAEQIRRDNRLNGGRHEMVGRARRVEAAIMRSAIARAPLRLVNERLAMRRDDDGSSDAGDGAARDC